MDGRRPPTTYDWARRRRRRPLAGAFTSDSASISRYIMPSDLVRLHVRYTAPSARAVVADPCPLPRRTSASPTRRGIRIGKTSVHRPSAIPQCSTQKLLTCSIPVNMRKAQYTLPVSTGHVYSVQSRTVSTIHGP